MTQRLLIVDDDPFIRDLYEEVFKGEGFEVTTAENGELGLSHLKNGGYDAVLLDIMMPKLDGLGVLTSLKENPPDQPNGPIILLTNLDHDPMVEKAKSQGAYSYVLKADVLPPQLVASVREAIESSKTRQPDR